MFIELIRLLVMSQDSLETVRTVSLSREIDLTIDDTDTQ